jgi:hypothetical protein
MHIELWLFLGNSTWKLSSNIKMDLTEIGCENGTWMELAEHHVQRQALELVFCLVDSITIVLVNMPVWCITKSLYFYSVLLEFF